VAINNKTLQDEDRTYSDWIEIYNGDSLPINLIGWYLTDDAANFSKWAFPDIFIAPDEYIIVFVSGKDRETYKFWKWAIYLRESIT
jgi:hypothetical protein